MERTPDYLLEQSRADKIKSLGFICYNLYVDGSMAFPEMTGIVREIKTTTAHLEKLNKEHLNREYIRMHEEKIADLLDSLGMICYNLYNDSKLINKQVLEVCDSIAMINSEITGGFTPAISDENRNGSSTKGEIGFEIGDAPELEPIPNGYIQCSCGYRNKPEANFCGKCGVELH